MDTGLTVQGRTSLLVYIHMPRRQAACVAHCLLQRLTSQKVGNVLDVVDLFTPAQSFSQGAKAFGWRRT